VALAARLMLRYRRWDKLLGYAAALAKVSDARVHPDARCWGTVTGRWSYRRPNLQNIPKTRTIKDRGDKRTYTAPGLRDVFVARPGHILVEADYNQLELRILAFLSQDTLLLKWFKEGLDVHLENAKRMLCPEPTPQHREFAKRLVYGMNYGGGADTLWKNLLPDFPGLFLSDVERFVQFWYRDHAPIKTWQQKILATARTEGYTECPLSGRRSYHHDNIEPTKIYNFPIQGTAADIIDGAIERIAGKLKANQHLLVQVHDALLGETTTVRSFARLLRKEMERPVMLELTGAATSFPVEIKVGQSWGSMEKLV